MAGGLTLCHAMKSITPNLAVGGEGFYHLHKPLKGASLAARAVWGPKEEHVATVKAGSFGQAELSYQRKVSDNPNPKPDPNPTPNPNPTLTLPQTGTLTLTLPQARTLTLTLPQTLTLTLTLTLIR